LNELSNGSESLCLDNSFDNFAGVIFLERLIQFWILVSSHCQRYMETLMDATTSITPETRNGASTALASCLPVATTDNMAIKSTKFPLKNWLQKRLDMIQNPYSKLSMLPLSLPKALDIHTSLSIFVDGRDALGMMG
jgi:hypothetical protein